MNRSGLSYLRTLAAAVVIETLLAAGGSAEPQREASELAAQPPASSQIRNALNRVRSSVVTIETMSGPRMTAAFAEKGTPAGKPPVDKPLPASHQAVGTGIVFDERGYIVTCSHVIADANRVFIRLADGRRQEAIQVFQDSWTDLAVLKLPDGNGLHPPQWADSTQTQVGDYLIAVGNSFGVGQTVTTGLVSSSRRHLLQIPAAPLLQTDIAMNPAMSGGAILNLQGEVVALAEGETAGVTLTEASFAIPINLVRDIAQRLILNGAIDRPAFGFETEALAADIAARRGLKQDEGVIVCDVDAESPAEAAGLEVGDVITAIDGQPLSDHVSHFERLEHAAHGEALAFTVLRSEERITVSIIPKGTAPGKTPNGSQHAASLERGSSTSLGIEVAEASRETWLRLGYPTAVQGVLVTHVAADGLAASQGICAGMAVRRLNGVPIHSVAKYAEAVRRASVAEGIELLVETPRQKHFVLCQAPPNGRDAIARANSNSTDPTDRESRESSNGEGLRLK